MPGGPPESDPAGTIRPPRSGVGNGKGRMAIGTARDDAAVREHAEPSRPAVGTGWPPVLAALSLGAALIHAAVAAQHDGLLGRLFVATALVQGAWALVVVVRPRTGVLVIGLLVNLAALLAYVASRTVGLGSLEAVEPFGTPDVVCAVLEAAIVVSVAYLLSPRSLLPSYRRIGPLAAGSVVALVVIAAVPGLAATSGGHAHGGAAHDAGAHDAGGGHDHDAAGQSSFVRDAQRRTDQLVAETRLGAARWRDPEQAEADGFRWIGDGPFLHYVNWKWVDQAGTLDPRRPEALVYAARADGTTKLIAAMYVTPFGTTASEVPAVQGASWHDHGNLCWDDSMRLSGYLDASGVCLPEGTLKVLPPMLHVSMADNRCGPFGDVEQSRDPVAEGAVAAPARRRDPPHDEDRGRRLCRAPRPPVVTPRPDPAAGPRGNPPTGPRSPTIRGRRDPGSR